MNRKFLVIAVILGCLDVVMGAFAAHSLKGRVPPDALDAFQTGVRYQMYHTLVLLFVAMTYEKFDRRRMQWAGNSLVAGIILFSGSLYAMTMFRAADISGMDKIGIITPVGGLLLIAGWIFILLAVIKKKQH